MRRRLVALLLVLAACGGADNEDAAPAPSTSSTAVERSTTSTIEPECSGIGALTGDHDITYVRDGRIWTDDGRCIAAHEGEPRLEWGGDGDRLLAGARTVLLAGGPNDVVGDDVEALGWSRPTGKAIVVRDDEGALSKRSLEGEAPLALAGFPLGDGEVLYHPAGTAIAAVDESGANVVLASNRGEEPRWLLANEPADAVTDIAFSADGDLLFVAVHDGVWHLHRLVLGEAAVSDVLVAPEPIGEVTASPWSDTAVAAARGTCEDPGDLFVRVGDDVRDLTGTPVAHGRPIGWTPTTALVVLVADECDGDVASGDLYTVHGTEIALVAEDVSAAAVRAQLPPPPPPPPAIEAAPA